MKKLAANALPLLIGSLPMENHEAAARLVFENTPEIPLWVQLPIYKSEGMVAQFVDGLPGLVIGNEKYFIDTGVTGFDDQVVEFFEEYIAVTEAGLDLNASRFALPIDKRKGFDEFLKQVDALDSPPFALKGQVTGPITFGTGIADQENKSIFYHDTLRDVAVKRLAMNAAWQAREFHKRKSIPVVFIDEPALAGLGTSAYITISKEAVVQSIEEIAAAIHLESGFAGVHVCANTEWDLLLDSEIDIISFDAYTYFDRFSLYPDLIKKYIGNGKIIAWGIVPTSNPEEIQKETVSSLFEKLEGQISRIESFGIDRKVLLEQSFITPSCGTGSLSLELAQKVIFLTRELSKRIRADLTF